MTVQCQKGVSLVAALFIIVIFAFMGSMFLTFVNTGGHTAVEGLRSTQTRSIAEGGLHSTRLR